MGACCDSGESMRPERAPAGGLKTASGTSIKIEYFENAYSRPDPLVQLLKHKGVPFEFVTTT